MELSFTKVPTPSAREGFFYHAITYQREHGAIIHPTPHTPNLCGVLLPCYDIPRVAGSYHSPKSPNPHHVRCSPTLLLHTNGCMELSFTQVPTPPPCEVFSYLTYQYKLHTYEGEQGAIIHPSPHTPTLCGVLLPCYYIPTGAWSYHSPKSQTPPCEMFSYLAITYQGEQGAIIHQSPQTPTL